MEDSCKVMIAGVGGQGVVFLTNVIVDAGVYAGIPVAASEIHGLAQRGGSVISGITFGKNTFGFIEEGGANFLIGLELLEAQRCLPYLNKNSKSVIANNKVIPHAVNTGNNDYPDSADFIKFLRESINQLDFVAELNKEIDPINRNIYILGRAAKLKGFPLSVINIEKSIQASTKEKNIDKSIKAFQLGYNGK